MVHRMPIDCVSSPNSHLEIRRTQYFIFFFLDYSDENVLAGGLLRRQLWLSKQAWVILKN